MDQFAENVLSLPFPVQNQLRKYLLERSPDIRDSIENVVIYKELKDLYEKMVGKFPDFKSNIDYARIRSEMRSLNFNKKDSACIFLRNFETFVLDSIEDFLEKFEVIMSYDRYYRYADYKKLSSFMYWKKKNLALGFPMFRLDQQIEPIAYKDSKSPSIKLFMGGTLKDIWNRYYDLPRISQIKVKIKRREGIKILTVSVSENFTPQEIGL